MRVGLISSQATVLKPPPYLGSPYPQHMTYLAKIMGAGLREVKPSINDGWPQLRMGVSRSLKVTGGTS